MSVTRWPTSQAAAAVSTAVARRAWVRGWVRPRGDGPYRVVLGGTGGRYVQGRLLLFGLRLRRRPAGAGLVLDRLIRLAVRAGGVHGDQGRRVAAAAHRTVPVALGCRAGTAAFWPQRQVQKPHRTQASSAARTGTLKDSSGGRT